MSRLSRIAISKRSVTLLFAAALFVAGILGVGQPQAGAAAGHRFPGHHRRHPVPGRRVLGRRRADRPSRSRTRSAASRGSRPPSRPRPTPSRWSSPSSPTARTSRTRPRRSSDAIAERTCRPVPTPTVQALNINASPVVIASIAREHRGQPRRGRPRSPGPRSCPRSQAIDGVARADLTGGLEQRLFVTLDPAKLAATGVSPASRSSASSQANNLTVPSGQLPADGSKVPVSTIGNFDLGRPDRER